MVYHYTDEGKPYQLSFLLYLPPGYVAPATQPATQPAAAAEPFPMLVFMSGLGERERSTNAVCIRGSANHGGAAEVKKWLPMIMVGPQCPADSRI